MAFLDAYEQKSACSVIPPGLKRTAGKKIGNAIVASIATISGRMAVVAAASITGVITGNGYWAAGRWRNYAGIWIYPIRR